VAFTAFPRHAASIPSPNIGTVTTDDYRQYGANLEKPMPALHLTLATLALVATGAGIDGGAMCCAYESEPEILPVSRDE